MIEVLRRLSKIIKVRSAMAVAMAKAWDKSAILHNSSYNDYFLSSKIRTLKIVRSELITSIM